MSGLMAKLTSWRWHWFWDWHSGHRQSITLLRSLLVFFLVFLLQLQHSTSHDVTLPLLASSRPAAPISLHHLFRRQTPSPTNSSLSTYEQSPAADGTDPSRSAASSLLFSIPTILLGLLLLLAGRALPRFCSSLAFAIATAFPTWALCVNLVGVGGLTGRSSSQAEQNLAIWGLVAGSFLFGFSIGLSISQYAHRIGLHLLTIQSGFALGISILIFSHQLTIHSTAIRWVFLGLLASLFAILTLISRPPIPTSIACAISGSFLLFLGLDLLVNENSGISLGIRFLFDHNHHHTQDLAEYHPPVVTRIFLVLSWGFMLLGSGYQYKILSKEFHPTWPAKISRKRASYISQSASLIDQDPEANIPEIEKEVSRLSAISVSSQSQEKSREVEDLSSLASPQPQGFESPSDSEPRCTTDSYDTGLSAIPELTERSSSGRGGSRSGSGSGRGVTGMFPHSHRHPSNSTYNSMRRSTLSSEHQVATTAPPSISGIADPSNISVSPPLTVLTETTVFPDDSVSQTARQRLGLTIYSHSGLIEEETEVMITPVREQLTMEEDDARDHAHRQASNSAKDGHSPLLSHATTPGSTGLLSRLARAFADGSTSVGRPSGQQTPLDGQFTEEMGEEQALECDAERWAQLKDGQPPYGHAARLRRDLHSWTTDEPA